MDGKAIKERRKALGLSRFQLAQRSGVDQAVLQLIELGDSLDEESYAKLEQALTKAENDQT